MAISLYDATVPGYLQILGAVEKFLERGAAHAREHGTDLAELVEARLYFDMLPLRFQIVSISHHSRGAIEGAARGLFEPPESSQSFDYTGLQTLITQTRQALETIEPESVNALQGKDMIFQLGDRTLPFIADDFLLSFSVPNFFFHATTAYDILRTKGVALGKRDFIGRLRLKA
jgi:hypothetical protein